MGPLIAFMESIKQKEIRDSVAKSLTMHLEIMVGGNEYAVGKV